MSKRKKAARWRAAGALVALFVGVSRPGCAQGSAQNGAPRPASHSPPDTVRLDLRESIHLALASATPIQIGQDSVRLSGIALLESYGRYLPSLTTTVGGFGEAGNTLLSATSLLPANAAFYGLGYQLTAGINLFNGYRDREHLRASIVLQQAAAEGFDRVRQEVAYDVSQAFFQVVLDQRLRNVAQATLDLSGAREAELTDQVRIGTRAPPDLYREQAQRSADETALIDADNRVETDITALVTRIRLDPSIPYAIIDPPADTAAISADSLQLAQLIAQALRARPDVSDAAHHVEAAQHGVIEAHGELLPQVALNFNVAAASRIFGHETVNGVNQLTVSQNAIGDQLSNQWTGALSLGFSWNVFDDYKARLDVQRANVTLDRDRLGAEDLKLRVAGEVQQAIGDYRAAEQKLKSTEAGLASAQLAYDAVQARYDVGFQASIVDVLSAQTALSQARALREQALINMALQKAVLHFAVGDAPPE